MDFPPDVRIKALTEAAMHCCVCNRYKGVNVEVHHIEFGGSNDFDNAIALCYDCHAFAGHYNPKHPRGSRYSPKLLREARDKWYKNVKTNSIEPPDKEDLLYCWYLVCKDPFVLEEMLLGNFDNIPIRKLLFYNSSFFDFLRSAVVEHPDILHRIVENDRVYANDREYYKTNPSAKVIDRGSLRYPYFKTERKPTEDELKRYVSDRSLITDVLLRSGVKSEEVAVVLGQSEACGGPGSRLYERYCVRSVWPVFIAIKNVSGKNIKNVILEGYKIGDTIYDICKLGKVPNATKHQINLPKPPILNHTTLLVPIGFVLPPPAGIIGDQGSSDTVDGRYFRTELANVQQFSSESDSSYFWGPNFFPKRVNFSIGGRPESQEVHDFDLSNLYILDRYWSMGSCPHLFYIWNKENLISYEGELFPNKPESLSIEVRRIPKNVGAIIVAELEEEKTYIEIIEQKGKVLIEKHVIAPGSYVRLQIESNSVLSILGSYTPSYKLGETPSTLITNWQKNEIVRTFMYQHYSKSSRGSSTTREP